MLPCLLFSREPRAESHVFLLFLRFAVCVEGLADFFYGYLDKDADGDFFSCFFFWRPLTSTVTVKSSWCSSCYRTLNPKHFSLSLSLSLFLSLSFYLSDTHTHTHTHTHTYTYILNMLNTHLHTDLILRASLRLISRKDLI